MAITPLPPAPLPTDSTSVFNSKAFEFVAALEGFGEEANDLAVEVNADAAAALSSQTAAASSATSATASATSAAASATLATTRATSATASATSASNSAAAALTSANNADISEAAAATSAAQAASAVAAVNLPTSLIGQYKKILRVNLTETGYELVASAAAPRLYGFALSSDGTELLFTDTDTGSFNSSDFVSWELGENLTFAITNNQLALTA